MDVNLVSFDSLTVDPSAADGKRKQGIHLNAGPLF